MKDLTTWILSIVALLGAGAAGYYYGVNSGPKPVPPVAESVKAVALPSASPSPSIHYPVADFLSDPSGLSSPSAANGLPPLDESDSAVENQLTSIVGKTRLDMVLDLKLKGIIRRLVVTIENGTARLLPREFLPFKPAPGTFKADATADGPMLSSQNYARYSGFVNALTSIDTNKTIFFYSRYYPLFQAAYRDLGILGYFNDRVVAVIDDCLAAPEVTEPIKLVQPSVYYKFADADLEGRSASQKILLRMGPANAARVKAKLREFREKLIHLDK